MKTKIFLLLITFLLINFVVAQGEFCVDFDKPEWPESTNFILNSLGNNIQLTWTPATDIPNCSGISHYDIYRSLNGGSSGYIARATELTYTDLGLDYGTYIYTIYPWDLAKHEGVGISKTITLGGSTPSGRRGGSSSSYWECEEWSACINETQTRTCIDITGILSDRTETKECFPEFISTREGNETEEIVTETTPPGFFATITGAVVDTLGIEGTVVVSIFVIAIVALTIVFSVKGRKK